MLWQKVGLFNGYLIHGSCFHLCIFSPWAKMKHRREKKDLEGRKIASSGFRINWCSLSKLLYGRKPCKTRVSMNHYSGELQLLKWMKLATPNCTVLYGLWNLHLLCWQVKRVQNVSYNIGKKNCNNGKIDGTESFNFTSGYFILLRNLNFRGMLVSLYKNFCCSCWLIMKSWICCLIWDTSKWNTYLFSTSK